MTFRRLVLATTILTAATGFTFAQSGPSPTNSSDSNLKATAPSGPTDTSAASASGNTMSKGSMARSKHVRARTKKHVTTTGMGRSGRSNMGEVQQKNVSPGSQSPASGIQKEK
jgi:hypothetical protein